MEYDPNEMFREDPGEMELSPEFNAEMQLQQEAAQLEDTPPPTEEELRLLREEIDPYRYVIGR